jgi:hypothetical protein
VGSTSRAFDATLANKDTRLNTIGAPVAFRLSLLSLVAAVLFACALVPPEMEPLQGELVEGKGVMIGRGTFPDGTEWNAHARTEGGLLCISEWKADGAQHGGSCSGDAQTGWAGGLGASFECGGSTFVHGSYDGSVASVRVETTQGVHETALVPLRALGLPSRAFGFGIPPGARLLSVTTLDANGAEIEHRELPPNGQCP